MKVVLFVLAFAAVALAIDAVGEGNSGAPAQVVNPANWHGTWTAKNRYGGVMYACPRGNRLYGVYSNAGFFIGKIEGREVEGTWYEGGRGDRNDWQGSFRITISDDNQSFDGFWYRVTQDGTEIKWHEQRLGAPYPSEPSNIDCLVPYQENVLGSFYSNPGEGREPVVTHLCKDRWDQIYGSFHSPDGYVEGWSVDNSSGFHGYRYDSDGRSGAYILRSVSETEVRGFYWRGRLAAQNIATSQEEVFYRTSFTAKLSECEEVGPGFLERLRGPARNSAGVLTISALSILAALAFVL